MCRAREKRESCKCRRSYRAPAGGAAVEPRTTRLVETRNSRCILGFPGSADDETGGDEKLASHVGIAGVFRLLAKGFKGGASQVNAGEPDGGERGQRELGEVDVVKADDGEVLGDAQAFHVGGAEDADGGHVVGAEDGGGLRRECAQPAESGHAALQCVFSRVMAECSLWGPARKAILLWPSAARWLMAA